MRFALGLLVAATLQTGGADSSSRVWIEGGSNVAAKWSCRAERFDARMDSGYVSVRLGARDLKCGNQRMDRDLYAALKDSAIAARFDSRSQGTLSVAGVERRVIADVTVEQAPDGSYRARGSVPLLMTDFGIKPPVGLFGLIRSKNELVVRFDLVIRPDVSEW